MFEKKINESVYSKDTIQNIVKSSATGTYAETPFVYKDVIAYFNKNYIHTGVFPNEMGRKIAKANKIREDSDYVDEFIVKEEETKEQLDTAKTLIKLVEQYIMKNGTNNE